MKVTAKPAVFREGLPPLDGKPYVRFVEPVIGCGVTVATTHLYSVIDVSEEIAVAFLDCGEIDVDRGAARWQLDKADDPPSKPWLQRDWLATQRGHTIRAKSWSQLMAKVLSAPRVCACCGQKVRIAR